MSALTPDETILGLMAVQTCYGYELIESFNSSEELGEIWKMSSSQIYAVLKRLEQQGLITGRVIESDSAPSRTEYYLTQAGQERLKQWLEEPQPSASIRHIRVEFLSRLYIAQKLHISTVPIVLRQRAACEAERERLLEGLGKMQAGMGSLSQELVIAQLEAVLRWIETSELGLENAET